MAKRQRLAELLDSVAPEGDQWDAYSRRSNKLAIRALREEWSEILGSFEWEFDGKGVYEHSIALSRLNELSGALGQTLRWTARDLAILEGRPVTTDFGALVEPVITGTFEGSFGIRVAAPPVVEQIEMFPEGTLFERTASRVLAVFKASGADNVGQEVVDLLTGLRQNAVNGFKNLTRCLAESGAPTGIRWQGDTVWTVTTADAAELLATLSEVEPVEEEMIVAGTLVGGDSESGQFHIAQRRDTGDIHYRGKAEEGATQALEGQTLGTMVLATLIVVRLESRFTDEPKLTYLLRHIAPAVSGG